MLKIKLGQAKFATQKHKEPEFLRKSNLPLNAYYAFEQSWQMHWDRRLSNAAAGNLTDDFQKSCKERLQTSAYYYAPQLSVPTYFRGGTLYSTQRAIEGLEDFVQTHWLLHSRSFYPSTKESRLSAECRPLEFLVHGIQKKLRNEMTPTKPREKKTMQSANQEQNVGGGISR